MISRRLRVAIGLGLAALALSLLALRFGPESFRPGARDADAHERSRVWRSRARMPGATPSASVVPIDQVECTLDHLVAQLREASRLGSPAYTSYLFDLVTSLARRLPVERVLAMLETERDPTVLEALGRVLCEYHAETGNGAVLGRILRRARGDADPLARAALVRSLRATAEPASVTLRALESNGVPTYDALVRDRSPEVRRAVVDNIAQEIESSSGHDPDTAREALRVARASSDARTRAEILEHVSLEHASEADLSSASALIHDEAPDVAAAAARALGTVPAERASDAAFDLVRLYREPISRAVRSAILAAVVQLRFAGAIPVLESLVPVDPSMSAEISAWIAAIRTGYQLFDEIAREKARLERSAS